MCIIYGQDWVKTSSTTKQCSVYARNVRTNVRTIKFIFQQAGLLLQNYTSRLLLPLQKSVLRVYQKSKKNAQSMTRSCWLDVKYLDEIVLQLPLETQNINNFPPKKLKVMDTCWEDCVTKQGYISVFFIVKENSPVGCTKFSLNCHCQHRQSLEIGKDKLYF